MNVSGSIHVLHCSKLNLASTATLFLFSMYSQGALGERGV